jgi:hypothetical protein
MDVQRRWTVDNGFDQDRPRGTPKKLSWQHPAPKTIVEEDFRVAMAHTLCLRKLNCPQSRVCGKLGGEVADNPVLRELRIQARSAGQRGYFRLADHPGIEKAFDLLFSHSPETNK